MPRQPTITQKVSAVKEAIAGTPIADVSQRLGVSTAAVAAWIASFESGGKDRLKLDYPTSSSRSNNPPDPSIDTVANALSYASPWLGQRTYGFFLSNALAVVLANGLRSLGLHGVLPDERGGFESAARSSKGLKKLDVNYSTPEMGLGLGLSVKTISSPDPATKRFTKNYSRNDNELRAEAVDYHRRQPYAVLGCFLFMPADCCDDAGVGKGEEQGISSFGAAVRYFRWRTPRSAPDDEDDRFEAFFVATYDPSGETRCWPVHDVDRSPPKSGRPKLADTLSVTEALANCNALFVARNNPPFSFLEEATS